MSQCGEISARLLGLLGLLGCLSQGWGRFISHGGILVFDISSPQGSANYTVLACIRICHL
jgi:hypothetical protein